MFPEATQSQPHSSKPYSWMRYTGGDSEAINGIAGGTVDRYGVQDYFGTRYGDTDAPGLTPSLLAKHMEGLRSGRLLHEAWDCGGWSHERCVLQGHAWANAHSLSKGVISAEMHGPVSSTGI